MHGRKLKIFAWYLTTAVWLLLISCMDAMKVDSGSGIPLPRTPSIIPLAAGTEWIYSHTTHDSLPNDTAELNYAIDRVYGLADDTTLILITEINVNQKFLLYVYEYEWEMNGYGLLLSYRDQHVDTTGIYIHGEYSGEIKTLYPKPILWLRYPAAVGNTWFQSSSDTTDTLRPFYEVIDTSAVMSIPTQQTKSMTPLEFVYCYLYRKTIADTVSYFYYTPSYGSVGSLEYVSGTLNRSSLLKTYSLPF